MKVVLIDGSPAAPSRVGVLLTTTAAALARRGYDGVILSLQGLQLPSNDPQYHLHPEQHPDPKVRDFAASVHEAEIVILGTPLYHGSYSGLIKLALDHLADNAFKGKVIGIVSNASGPRSSFQAAQALVPVAHTLKGEVINRLVGTCKADYGERDGVFQITDSGILERIELFTDELVQKAAR